MKRFWIALLKQQFVMLHLPGGCSDLWSQKLFELFQKFELTRLRTSFHRSQLIYRTVRSAIFYRCARYIFARVLMHAPTVSDRAITLNALITAIRCTFWNIPRFRPILFAYTKPEDRRKGRNDVRLIKRRQSNSELIFKYSHSIFSQFCVCFFVVVAEFFYFLFIQCSGSIGQAIRFSVSFT